MRKSFTRTWIFPRARCRSSKPFSAKSDRIGNGTVAQSITELNQKAKEQEQNNQLGDGQNISNFASWLLCRLRLSYRGSQV